MFTIEETEREGGEEERRGGYRNCDGHLDLSRNGFSDADSFTENKISSKGVYASVLTLQ